MSLTVLADRGKKAFEDRKFEEAVTHFTAAIEQAPESPDLFLQRSVAYQRAQKLVEALKDAEQAVLYAMKRAKRELIIDAQFRRGQLLQRLDRQGDACFILDLVLSKSKDHKEAAMWKNKAEKALNALGPEDPLRTCTVSEKPIARASTAITDSVSSPSTAGSDTPSSHTASPVSTTSPPQQTPVDKIRYDWYQNNDLIYFTLLAKGVPKDKAQIDIAERSVSVEFPLLSGSSYQLTLDPLFAAVKPEKCIVTVLPSKVEIHLAKATAGQKWASLESKTPVEDATVRSTAAEAETAKSASFKNPIMGAPAYPTSSKKGAKDWDKIANDDDEDEGSGDPNDFFKKIFKSADPNMQRAMMKSYQESNGTSLSTNWDEVSKGKVETLPPDGMEAKSWKK